MELDWWDELTAALAIWRDAHAATKERTDARKVQRQQAEAALNDFLARATNPGRAG